MLDFILVLGQIPGTNIQISFWGLLVLLPATWLGIRIYRRPALRRKYAYWVRVFVHYIQHFHLLRRPQH